MTSVLYEKKGKIVYITLNRPDKLNSISAEMFGGTTRDLEDF